MKYCGTEVRMEFNKYTCNNRLAMTLIDDAGYIYTCVTVNLVDEDLTNENCAFIDTNNNGDEIVRWLNTNSLGKFTGAIGISGYCMYPEFEFSKEVLEKFDEA